VIGHCSLDYRVPENRVERHHQASLFAAKKRAELRKSTLDSSTLSFEYNLTGL
jgi:hypothetical protein